MGTGVGPRVVQEDAQEVPLGDHRVQHQCGLEEGEGQDSEGGEPQGAQEGPFAGRRLALGAYRLMRVQLPVIKKLGRQLQRSRENV